MLSSRQWRSGFACGPASPNRLLEMVGASMLVSGAALVVDATTLFAQAAPPLPPTPLPPALSTIPVRGPSDAELSQFLDTGKKDELRALGKALLWDGKTSGGPNRRC